MVERFISFYKGEITINRPSYKKIILISVITIAYFGALILNYNNYGWLSQNSFENTSWLLILQALWNFLVLTLLYGILLVVILSKGKIKEEDAISNATAASTVDGDAKPNGDARPDVLEIARRMKEKDAN